MGEYNLSPNLEAVKEATSGMIEAECPSCGRTRHIPENRDPDEHKCGYCREK